MTALSIYVPSPIPQVQHCCGILVTMFRDCQGDWTVQQIVQDIEHESINTTWHRHHWIALLKYRTLVALAQIGRWA